MGLLSSSLKSDLQKGNPSAYFLLEVDFPSGTRRYSKLGVSSSSQGHYEGRVLTFQPLLRSVSNASNSLEFLETQVTISDYDCAFASLLGKRERILNSDVRIYLGSANVAFSDWLTVFTGILAQWESTAPMQWTLTLRTDDTILTSNATRVKINVYDWPDAHSDAIGATAPLLYGAHDSSGETDTGAVPTLYVDTSGFRYAVCLGRAYSIPRVYVGGTLQTTGYSITYPVVGGRMWTLIDFTADKGSSAVTCDA